MGFSNASLEYLNYPTQVESKLLQHVGHDKKNLEGRKIVFCQKILEKLVRSKLWEKLVHVPVDFVRIK